MLPSSSDPFTPWTPLVPLGDPEAVSQPQVPALQSFWRRVRADIVAARPEEADRLDRLTQSAVGLSEELTQALSVPLSVPMLQSVHILATRDQTAARVTVSDGSFRYVPFPYGKLKDKPNHLSVGGRVVREFCPPERVIAELEVVLREHERIPAEMLDVRAAWLVHAFLQVHPFADGNGRVSRILANWNFMRAGLPALWSETSERGTGWADALNDAAQTGDLRPLTRLLATHQERLVTRLLLLAEAPPPDRTLDEAIAHRDLLRALRAQWHPHAALLRAQVPELASAARTALDALAARLGGDLEVTVQLEARDAAWRQAAASGLATDRHEPGALITLTSRAPKARIRLGLAALGASGSGAWVAFAQVRPRSAIPSGSAALTLLPEESASTRATRFQAWLDRVLADAVGVWIRIA